jgi:hypothetical protein
MSLKISRSIAKLGLISRASLIFYRHEQSLVLKGLYDQSIVHDRTIVLVFNQFSYRRTILLKTYAVMLSIVLVKRRDFGNR